MSHQVVTDLDQSQPSFVQQLKAMDESRKGFSGEHWLVLGVGLAAWGLSRNSPSFVVRTLGLVVGTALAGRAASGRDGLSKLLRWTPLGGR